MYSDQRPWYATGDLQIKLTDEPSTKQHTDESYSTDGVSSLETNSSLFHRTPKRNSLDFLKPIQLNSIKPQEMDNEYGSEMMFKENSPKHRCCCRCMHVRTGAVVIGILKLICLIFLMVNSIVLFAKSGTGHEASFSVTFVGTIAGIVAIVLMFAGIFTSRPRLLIPHMALQIVGILLLLVLMSLCVAALLAGSAVILHIINVDDSYPDAARSQLDPSAAQPISFRQHHMMTFTLSIILIVAMLILLLAAAVEFWLFMVVYWCFRFLRMKSKYKKPTERVFVVENGADSYPMHRRKPKKKENE